MSILLRDSILFNLTIFSLRDVFAPIVQNYAFEGGNAIGEEERGGKVEKRSIAVTRSQLEILR